MDLRELRSKIAQMIEEADSLKTKVVIECNGQEYEINDIFIDTGRSLKDDCIIIQTE